MTIYYTGVGAKKSGKHTIREFLKIMNKYHNKSCSQYLTGLKSEPCIKQNKMNEEYLDKYMKNYMKNNSYRYDKKTEKKYNRLMNKCQKQKTTYKNRSCHLDEYIQFSGAEKKSKIGVPRNKNL